MDKLSISGTVSFKKDCKERWQTVYTSSLYGTMFSLFGKFNYDATNTTLGMIELKIINYKGLIDLGIKDVDFQENRKWVEVYDEDNKLVPKNIRVISLKVVLQGLLNQHWKDRNINIILNEVDLADDIYIEIDRELQPLVNDNDRTLEGVFDTEHYYRDGIRPSFKFGGAHIEYRSGSKLNPTMNRVVDTTGNITFVRASNDEEDNSSDKSPGAVCPKGYSKIIF